jgi:hypothetical protein
MADDYSLTVSTGEGKSTLEVHGSPELIRQLLQTLWGSQNGTTPAPRADPPATTIAKPPRRHHKRPVPVPPELERKCAFCANPFSSKFSGAKYCSERCKTKAHQVQQERPSPPGAARESAVP